MANGSDNSNVKVANAPKKADVILKIEREISVKQEEMNEQQKATAAQVETALNEIAKARQEISDKSEEKYNALKREMHFVALQNENIFARLTDKLAELSAVVDNLKSGVPAGQPAAEQKPAEIDYELLADRVAARIPVPVSNGGETVYAAPVATTPEIDYDVLAERIAKYLPAQETAAADAYAIDYDELADKVAARIPVPQSSGEQVVYAAPAATSVEIDYDFLADKVVSRIPVYDVLSPDYVAAKVAEQLGATPIVHSSDASVAEVDYEYLSDRVAEKIAVPEAQSAAEIDYDYLSEKVSEKIVVPQAEDSALDYDYLAEKLFEKIGEKKEQPIGEIDYDFLANAVAERIEIPAIVDYDDFCEKVAGSMVVPEGHTVEREVAVASSPVEININEEALAERIAAKIGTVPYDGTSVASVDVQIDQDELADKIALKVGSLKAENFDILVDDEGCSAISKEIIDKLDYDMIANTVAERLRDTFDLSSIDVNEPDYDEMAYRISEKITVAGVNEDAIADKAAQVLSNYLPEFDTDEIADKVAAQVISALPAVDNEIICAGISERVIESQSEHDYDIVLDEDGINNITESVAEKVKWLNVDRFDTVDREIAEIKAMLENGAVVREAAYTGSEAYEVTDDDIVTVSDIVSEAEEETVEEEFSEEEAVEEEIIEEVPVEEITEDFTEEEVIEEPDEEIVEEEEVQEALPLEELADYLEEENVEVNNTPAQQIVEVAENPAEDEDDDGDDEDDDDGDIEEFSYDDLNGEDGVDFLNMMRYNRSFIARIIQGTDTQKSFYGEVRTALLSYKKVNSNIAWGAERFHKGRETIARFKIRGKTLCLYLALDPNEYPYSVYYHKDVSNVRMFDGTPMMVKVKSPLYVRKAIRLIDEMLAKRGGEKREIPQRDYAAMYPHETIEELIEDGLVKEPKRK